MDRRSIAVGVLFALVAAELPADGGKKPIEQEITAKSLALVGQPAPDFTLTDLSGQAFHLAIIAGTPSCLIFGRRVAAGVRGQEYRGGSGCVRRSTEGAWVCRTEEARCSVFPGPAWDGRRTLWGPVAAQGVRHRSRRYGFEISFQRAVGSVASRGPC